MIHAINHIGQVNMTSMPLYLVFICPFLRRKFIAAISTGDFGAFVDVGSYVVFASSVTIAVVVSYDLRA